MCGTLKLESQGLYNPLGVFNPYFPKGVFIDSRGKEVGTITPGDTITVVTNHILPEACTLVAKRWGIDLAGKLLYNARSETILEKPTFAPLMQQGQRAVAMAHLFNEGPGWFTVAKGAPFGMACVYDSTGFAIITTAANEVVEPHKHRMPAILPANTWSKWLTSSPQEAIGLLKPLHPRHVQAA